MREADDVVAIAVSDLHLSHTPPACRSDEKDWYGCMERQLRQLRDIQLDHSTNPYMPVPLLVAGDVFDKWNPPVELVTFALKNLPDCIAVPGQHDLPHHALADMHRSAYGLLVQAGKIRHVEESFSLYPLMIHGFPWLSHVFPLNDPPPAIHIALIHAYVWKPGASYPDAPERHHLRGYKLLLKGYDFAIFGDNHKPFVYSKWGHPYPTVVNCGGFMRLTIDQRDHVPCAYLLRRSGAVERVALDVSEDVITETRTDANEAAKRDFAEFTRELCDLRLQGVDFEEAVRRALLAVDVCEEVRAVVRDALQNTKGML